MEFTKEHLEAYHRDGYVVVRQFFTHAEVDLLYKIAIDDDLMKKKSFDRTDAAGLKTKLALWYSLDESLYSKFARSERIVHAVEQILGGKAAHYHSKLMQKEPKTGGAWEWHQDYGYWYQNGCLFPDLASVFIALDPATRENGCLQLLKGSHRMGRIEHGRFGSQTGADPERVEAAMKRMELVYCEMEPGDAVFFHGNTLHSSDPNVSEYPRWGLICCYNTRSNDPYKESHHPNYTPLLKLDDSSIQAMGARGSETGKSFLEAKRDKTQSAN
jgi:ectoine hydroxylase-related dioxygenase (phytanoyl-CoA dioxygenase family)